MRGSAVIFNRLINSVFWLECKDEGKRRNDRIGEGDSICSYMKKVLMFLKNFPSFSKNFPSFFKNIKVFLQQESVSKLNRPIPSSAVGAGFACPKTQSKLFPGERTSPLRTKWQHCPRFDIPPDEMIIIFSFICFPKELFYSAVSKWILRLPSSSSSI